MPLCQSFYLYACLPVYLSVSEYVSVYLSSLISYHFVFLYFSFNLYMFFINLFFKSNSFISLLDVLFIPIFLSNFFLLSPSFLTFIFFSPSFILLFIFLYLFLLSPLPFPSFPFSSFLSLLPPMLNIPFSCIYLHLDKTGTLTQNLMSVANTWFMGKKHDIKSFSAQNEEVLYNIEALHVIFYYYIL